MPNKEIKVCGNSHITLENRYNPKIMEYLIIDEIDTRLSYARKTKNDPEPKEIEVARTLTGYFNTSIIFLPIRNIPNIKNPDIMIGVEFAEMKVITGNLNAVGRNFRSAIKQASIVILSIKSSDYTIKDIYRKIAGEIRDLINKDKWKLVKPESLIILHNNKIHTWNLVKYQKYK